MRHEETIEEGRALARGRGADLAAFYDRRAAAALAYCARLCAPSAIADAVEAAFARVFEAVAAGADAGEEALDRQLRSAVRAEAAARASAATAGVPARRLLERLADPGRGGACELMPALLAARADGVLGQGDVGRVQAHLRRCSECRTAELRFNEAERAFDALAGDDAPALGRSLLADMLDNAPLSERRRFARERLSVGEPPTWLEEIDWDDGPAPRVVEVPGDALDFATEAEAEPVVEPELEAEPEPEEEPEAPPAPADDAELAEAEYDEAPAEPAPEPALAEAPATGSPRHDPAVTDAATADFPALTRARLRAPSLPRLGARGRRRLAVALLVFGTLMLGEAGATVLWKEPITAFLAARAQDSLTAQLHKLDSSQIGGADARRLAATRGERARMAVLARREDSTVASGDALGLLRIDRLGVEYVFVQSTDAAALRKGPGHYVETPLPGEGGTVGVAGHRTTYEAPFRHIDELKAGDRISLKMPYGLFTYAVDRQRIVPADFKGAFAAAGAGGPAAASAGSGGERLVLSACHPLYSASERILVYAHLVSAQALGAAVETQPAAPAGPSARQIAQRRTAARLRALGTRTLAVGTTGDDVKELQRLLGLPATGTFGPETAAAVSDFQRTHGLPVVGQAGSQTKAALARRPHPPSRPPNPPAVAPQRSAGGQGQASPGYGQQPYGQQSYGTSTQPGYGGSGTQGGGTRAPAAGGTH